MKRFDRLAYCKTKEQRNRHVGSNRDNKLVNQFEVELVCVCVISNHWFELGQNSAPSMHHTAVLWLETVHLIKCLCSVCSKERERESVCVHENSSS